MENKSVNLGHKKSFKRFAKWLFLIIIAIIIIYIVVIFVSPQNREGLSTLIGQKLDQRSIKNYEKQIQADQYGGKTPQETYKMFVEALKSQDIDLAVKYFIKEKQDEYRIVLEDIKKSGKGEDMMKDLEAERNQKGEMIGNSYYRMEIENEKGELVTQIAIMLPRGFNQSDIISDIGKINAF